MKILTLNQIHARQPVIETDEDLDDIMQKSVDHSNTELSDHHDSEDHQAGEPDPNIMSNSEQIADDNSVDGNASENLDKSVGSIGGEDIMRNESDAAKSKISDDSVDGNGSENLDKSVGSIGSEDIMLKQSDAAKSNIPYDSVDGNASEANNSENLDKSVGSIGGEDIMPKDSDASTRGNLEANKSSDTFNRNLVIKWCLVDNISYSSLWMLKTE